jgi:hypothetical protein
MDKDATRRESKPRHDPVKEAFWGKAVADQRRSGQTVRAFCQSRGLTEPSFYAWRAELVRRDQRRQAANGSADGHRHRRTVAHSARSRSAKAASSFVALTVARNQSSLSSGPFIEIELPDGERLHVSSGCDRTTLDVVLNALRERPC